MFSLKINEQNFCGPNGLVHLNFEFGWCMLIHRINSKATFLLAMKLFCILPLIKMLVATRFHHQSMVKMCNIIKGWFIVRIILKNKASAIQILTSHMRIKVGLHYPTFIKNNYQLFIHFGMFFKSSMHSTYFS